MLTPLSAPLFAGPIILPVWLIVVIPVSAVIVSPKETSVLPIVIPSFASLALAIPPAVISIQPFVAVKLLLSKLASPKSAYVIPLAFALVVAAFMFNLLCAIAADALISLLSILPGLNPISI